MLNDLRSFEYDIKQERAREFYDLAYHSIDDDHWSFAANEYKRGCGNPNVIRSFHHATLCLRREAMAVGMTYEIYIESLYRRSR